jgi:outer membrane receptor for ferrienterochelin and colicin
MKKISKLLVIAFSSTLFSGALLAEENKSPQRNFFSIGAESISSDLSLNDILNIKVTVASQRAMSLRESPGIVSVITDEDIARMGARDLMDILHTVPGFQFGTDIQAAMGVAVRGVWAHEGKALIIIDGHEMNELIFQTYPFGNEFPVETIKRIEIIRGPGSAVYGGNAEVAVIKITTFSGEDLQGVKVNTYAGGRPGGSGRNRQLSRSGATLQVGQATENYSFKLGVSSSDSFRTNGNYFNPSDAANISLANANRQGPLVTQGQLRVGNAQIGVLYRDYNTTDRTGFGVATPEQVPLEFNSIQGTAKYEATLGSHLKLIPSFTYDRFTPWKSTGELTDGLANEDPINYGALLFHKTATRTRTDLRAVWDPTDQVNVVFGAERNWDSAVDRISTFASSNSDTIRFHSVAAFAQGIWQTDWANLTVGGRYFDHEIFGSGTVPRVGLTKAFGNFHTKLLASEAFRAPPIGALAVNPDIKTETTRVLEAEMGYIFTPQFSAIVNVFNSRIQDPIVYFVDDQGEDAYENSDRTGSQGLEVDFRYRTQKTRSNLSYSFYTSAGINQVERYTIPTQAGRLLGMPNHKFAFGLNHDFTAQFTLGTNLLWFSSKDRIANDEGDFAENAPVLLADLLGTYRNLLVNGLNLSAGIHNLLNQRYVFTQPYDGGAMGPIDGLNREVVVRLAYSRPF